MKEKEMWKDIPNYEGLYSISNWGQVKSLRKNLIMKLSTDSWGYYIISFFKNKKHKTFRVSTLVGTLFVENPQNKLQINHKNGIKTDNYFKNLEWTTQSENQIHAVKTGLKTLKGNKAPSRKLSEENIKPIKELLKEGKTHKYIANKFNVSEATIWKISAGRTWYYIN